MPTSLLGITIDAIKKKFSFKIASVDTVRPCAKTVHILTLSSPELEGVRMRNGFSPKIHDQDFHLIFAIEKA